VLLEQDGAGTMMTFIQQGFPDEAMRDSHVSGWTGALDKLEALFAD
jgi:Activator of Hsp90 ATPase homolog 1-like protein